jgi:hypothetical protein
MKVPPHMILKWKTMPKVLLPVDLIIRYQIKGWMINELVRDWLLVVWNRRIGDLLRK